MVALRRAGDNVALRRAGDNVALRRAGDNVALRRATATGLATLALAALAACRADSAAPPEAAVEVRDVWARPTPAAASVGSVYLTLRAATDDALVAVVVDAEVAAAAEVHETYTDPDTGAQGMQELPALPLPAGAEVAIETGGHHLMLVDLVAPLEAGTSFEITLEFEHADAVTTSVEVTAEGGG